MNIFHIHVKMCSYFHTGPGIYYGNIDISEAPEGHDNVTADSKLMLYPGEDVDRGINPKTIVPHRIPRIGAFPRKVSTKWNQKICQKIFKNFLF